MSAQDDLTRLIGVLHDLNPRALAAEVKYLRAGAKSPKLGVIGHSAEQPLPLPDRLDKQVGRDWKRYQKNLRTMVAAAEENRAIQARNMVRLHLDDGKPSEAARKLAEGDVGRSCENCGIVVEKLLNGRCRACHEYLKRKGVERPRDLIDREVFGGGK